MIITQQDVNIKTLRFVEYCRKSTEDEDRQIYSKVDQHKENIIRAQGLDIKIIKTLYEDKSAKRPGRVVFGQMIDMLTSGKADGIIVWHLNRLSRNPLDGGAIQHYLQNGAIRAIVTNNEVWYPDFDDILLSVHLGVATKFSKSLAADTTRGLKHKAERGWFPGSTPPLGYVHNPELENSKKAGKEILEIIEDEPRLTIIRKVFETILSRVYTPAEVYRKATNEWGLTRPRRSRKGDPIAESSFYRMLSNPFYYGTFEYPSGSGNIYEGKHTPILSKDQFDEIQLILGRSDASRPKVHNFTYSGIMRCAVCGSAIVAEAHKKTQKNGNEHSYVHYRCSRKRKIIPTQTICEQRSYTEERAVDKMVQTILSKIKIPRQVAEWVADVLIEKNRTVFEEKQKINDNLKNEISSADKELETLLDFAIKGRFAEEVYMRKKAEIEARKFSFQSQIKEEDEKILNWSQIVEDVLNFSTIAPERFMKSLPVQKRAVLCSLGLNLVMLDKNLHVDLHKPLEVLSSKPDEVLGICNRFEPPNKHQKFSDKELFKSGDTVMGG